MSKAEELADFFEKYALGGRDREAAAELRRLAQVEREFLALKEEFEQSVTDPENQPSQYGTITLEMHAEKMLDIAVKYENAVTALVSERQELAALKESIGEPVFQFRKLHCADWYDGRPDYEDGGGLYEIRTLYAIKDKQS